MKIICTESDFDVLGNALCSFHEDDCPLSDFYDHYNHGCPPGTTYDKDGDADCWVCMKRMLNVTIIWEE